METELKPLKLKSPIQQMIEWLKGQYDICIRLGKQHDADFLNGHISVATSLLEEEQRQITWAFDNGKCRDYGVADGDCEAKFGFQFYNETYTENETNI